MCDPGKILLDVALAVALSSDGLAEVGVLSQIGRPCKGAGQDGSANPRRARLAAIEGWIT